MRALDERFFLPQSLSGEAQSTCSDLDPMGSEHREEVSEFYFSLNVPWAACAMGGNWRKGCRKAF